jgi:predicted O-linked N-acetylglucosamine transferase (SPINDLY family)
MMPTIDQGKALHRMGRIAEAEAIYRSVLARDPREFDALHLLGLIRYQQGRAGEAQELLSRAIALRPRSPQALAILMAALLALGRLEEALAACDRLIALNPRDLDALYNRAVVLSRLRRFDDALLAFDKVLARDGGSVDALFERGNILAALGRFDEAVACYEALLKKAPAHLGALTNRGNALARLGRQAEALACYEALLAVRPGDLNALSNRGIALKELGRYEEAMASCERALKIDPNSVAALITRGNVLAKLSRYEEALASFERAAALDPRDVDALNNRGFALTQLRRFGDAFAAFDRALAIDPANIGVLDNRGAALLAMSRFEDALATFDRARALKPDDAETLYLRGHALANLARYEEAVSAWERVLAIAPGHPHALGALAFYRLMLCDWSKAEEFEAKLKRALEDERAVVEPFTLLAYPIGPADQLRLTRRFVRHRIPAGPRLAQARKARVGDKIRLAYLSADFRNHATAWLAVGLFELHDRSRFEVLGVSYGVDDGSETRRRLAAAFDQFHDVAQRSDREVAELLLDLGVDIAVDLKGHTQHGRPAILACRPAPVQVSYLGYPATMGVDFIDYVLADRIVLPFDQQPSYSEMIVHLPNCYQINDSKREIAAEAPTRGAVGLPETGFVFCSFNNSYKLTPQFFDVWMRLLRQVEGSVLWLLGTSEAATCNLRNEASARAVDPSRLVFAPKSEMPKHLARHRLADLFLDNLPVNAHTAASDALWVGLPVLTCIGGSFVGRVAASLLCAVGLPELITRSLDEYEALALKLATDPALIASLQQKLDRNRKTCPLFDTDRLRHGIERAYITMWEITRRGEPPRSFAVDAI